MKLHDGEIELNQTEVFEAVQEYVRAHGYTRAQAVSVTSLPADYRLEAGQERVSARLLSYTVENYDGYDPVAASARLPEEVKSLFEQLDDSATDWTELDIDTFADDLVERNKEALRGLAKDD